MSDPIVRASDDDRDAVAERLREAFAEGRLTDTELDDRLGRALAARTVADLAPLTLDLPVYPLRRARRHTPPATRPAGRPAGWSAGRPRVDSVRAAWAAWTVAVTINLLLWVLVALGTRELVYFWPIWVAGPWGAVLLVRTFGGSPGRPWCAARPG